MLHIIKDPVEVPHVNEHLIIYSNVCLSIILPGSVCHGVNSLHGKTEHTWRKRVSHGCPLWSRYVLCCVSYVFKVIHNNLDLRSNPCSRTVIYNTRKSLTNVLISPTVKHNKRHMQYVHRTWRRYFCNISFSQIGWQDKRIHRMWRRSHGHTSADTIPHHFVDTTNMIKQRTMPRVHHADYGRTGQDKRIVHWANVCLFVKLYSMLFHGEQKTHEYLPWFTAKFTSCVRYVCCSTCPPGVSTAFGHFRNELCSVHAVSLVVAGTSWCDCELRLP